MHISIENRLRLSLVLFVIGDHVVWYYGGFFARVSLPYSIASECVRLIACVGLIDSFYKRTFFAKSMYMVFVYCALMLLFLMAAGRSYTLYTNQLIENVFWIKKDATIPVDHPGFSLIFYIYYILSMYFFAWKFIPPENKR